MTTTTIQGSEAAGTASRLADILLDPASLAGMAVAGGAVLAILALTAKPQVKAAKPAAEAVPPLLDTPLKGEDPVLIAPKRVLPKLPAFGAKLSAAFFSLVGVATLFGLAFLAQNVTGNGQRVAVASADDEVFDDGIDTYVVRGNGIVAADGCAPGVDSHVGVFTHCGFDTAVRYEVIGFARDGQRLQDVTFSGAGSRPFVAQAFGAPTPFVLDARRADLVPPPGGDLSAYDAFVAIGFADEGVDGEAAEARAEARGVSLASFVLDEIRGPVPADCRSDALVHAVSLGARRATAEGPAPRPILIGVRSESRINGDAAALDQTLDGLLSGEGAALLGVAPDAYGPAKVLSSTYACAKSPY